MSKKCKKRRPTHKNSGFTLSPSLTFPPPLSSTLIAQAPTHTHTCTHVMSSPPAAAAAAGSSASAAAAAAVPSSQRVQPLVDDTEEDRKASDDKMEDVKGLDEGDGNEVLSLKSQEGEIFRQHHRVPHVLQFQSVCWSF
jgi:hypothetical protein